MKRIMKMLMAVLLFFSMFGCTPSTQPEEPSGGETEINVSNESFYKLIRYDEGKWSFPGQSKDWGLVFYIKDGQYWVDMTETAEGNVTHDYYQVMGITTNAEKKVYTLRLQEEGIDNVNFILHVDTSRLSDNYIYAECIYDGEKVTEYIFVQKAEEDPLNMETVYRQMLNVDTVWAHNTDSGLYFLSFNRKDGNYWCVMTSLKGYEVINDRYHIVDGSYDKENNQYVLRLQEDGFDNVNYILHLKFTDPEYQKMEAECIFDGDEIKEYTVSENVHLMKYVMNTEETIEQFRPVFTVYPDGTYVFTENVYEGMVEIYGIYNTDGLDYVCHNYDNSALQGFAGYDVTDFGFMVQENKVKISTDICFTRKGSEFVGN